MMQTIAVPGTVETFESIHNIRTNGNGQTHVNIPHIGNMESNELEWVMQSVENMDNIQVIENSEPNVDNEHIEPNGNEAIESVDAIVVGHSGARETKQTRFSAGAVAPIEIADDILRGVRLSRTLSWLGWYWRHRPAEADVKSKARIYSMSKPVHSIDAFCSHAWKSPGFGKYITLMGLFRRHRLLQGVLIAVLILQCLDVLGYLPFFASYVTWTGDGEYTVHISIWSSCLAGAVGLVHQFFTPVIFKEHIIFLDQVCINQVDPALKDRGINSLGGFLQRSKSMVVLWTPPYFTRLWCVFELAVYLHVNREDANIRFCPVFMEKVFVSMYISSYLASITVSSLTVLLFTSQAMVGLTYFSVCMMASVLFFRNVRCPLEEKRQLDAQLATFDCSKAECFLEKDRKLVERSIKCWHGSLEKFNFTVRKTLRGRIQGLVKSGQLTYTSAVCATSPLCSTVATYAAGFARSDMGASNVISFIIHGLGVNLLVMPVLTYLLFYLADRFVKKRNSRLAEIAVNVCLSTISALVLVVSVFTWLLLSKVHIALNAIPAAILVPVTLWCYGPRINLGQTQPEDGE